MPAPNGTSAARKCQYDEPASRVAKTTNPVAISPRPIAPVTRVPALAAIAGASRESGITTSAIGMSPAEAWSGEKPRTSWR